MSDLAPQHKTVFISYRRNVSSFIARAIFLDLRMNDYDVFMDVESINSGMFDTIILNQIAARAHFLVVCTPGTFERCSEPEDWLRREIEAAMDQNRNIVPVLANGFKFEDNLTYLTGKLADLPRLHGLPLYHEYFDEGMARLRDRYLKQRVTGALQPTPLAEQAVVEKKIEQAAALPTPTTEELTAEGFLYRAYNRAAQGNLDAAIADYDQAIRLNPDYAEAYDNRGNARALKGDLAGAIADYDQAIRIDPMDPWIYTSRGKARAAQGDLDGAIADFNAALQQNMDDAEACYNRGLAYYLKGKLDAALDDVNQALRLGANASRYATRAEIHFCTGNHAQARADFLASIGLGGPHRQAVAGLAVTIHALGQAEDAINRWRALAEVDPHYLDAGWVGKELNWRPELVEATRKLIAEIKP